MDNSTETRDLCIKLLRHQRDVLDKIADALESIQYAESSNCLIDELLEKNDELL